MITGIEAASLYDETGLLCRKALVVESIQVIVFQS